jgi:3'-5' exoribonuclease
MKISDIYSYGDQEGETTIANIDTTGRDTRKRKKQFIENLREGDVVNELFAVKMKSPPRPYKRGTWFVFVVTDRTGEINVKFWGGDNKDRVKRLYDSFKVGDVVQIRLGNVEIYEDRPEMSINEKNGGIRRCKPDEYFVGDFIPSLEENRIKELFGQIKKEIEAIQQDELRRLLEVFFEDREFVRDFTHSPSAMTHHHNYLGGNLEHTVGVIRLCKNICEMYPGINRDLVVTGAILHDIGKIKEYKTTATIDKTEQGNFIGHIVIGDRWIREKIGGLRTKNLPFSQELEDHLCHLILSHHGRYEFGSPRIPKIVEACVLNQADMMDSQVKNYMQSVDEMKKNTEEDWGFIWDPDLGRRRLVYLGNY